MAPCGTSNASNRCSHHCSAASPFTRKQVRTMLRVPRRSGGTGQSKNVTSVPGVPFASA
jgi:hypothetical protein